MKRIITLALSIVMSTSIVAAAEFFVKINSNGNYTVSLNNQVITSPSNIFRFFDLYPGNYSLKVMQNGYNGRCIYDQQIVIADGYRTVAELDAYYGLKIINKLPFVQQSWYVDNILSQPPVCNIPVPNPPVCNKPPQYPNHGGNHGHNYNGNNPPYNFPPDHNYPGTGYGYNGNLLDEGSLQTLIQTMKNATFEERMLEVARTALNSRQVKTTQVHQLLTLFTFEQNKLDLAKYCYDKTIDKNNYYSLYNDFTFSSYSSALDKYIHSR